MAPSRVCPSVCTALAVLAGVLVTLTGCSRQAAAPPPAPPAAVQLTKLTPTAIEDASTYLASLQSLSTTTIKPEVSGEVVRIFVKSGDRVAPGTPLVQIDPRVQRAAVSSQAAASSAQQAVAANARQQFERARTLLSVGAISQQEFDQAQANAAAAEKQLSSLNARVQQEQQTLQYYEVRAPAAGIVGDIPIRVGTRVTADTVLTTVNLNQDLEVYVPVPLDRSRDLRVGLPVQLFDGATNALVGDTTISYVSPTVDDQTQSVLVKARFPGDGQVRGLQFVHARIVFRTTTGLVVPVLAVLRINGQPFVFVAEQVQGRLVARQRAVELSEIVGNNYRVVQGLQPGDTVIVTGVQRLADGAPIRPA